VAVATTDDKSAADLARTIATLWGSRKAPRRGPKHTLTTAQVAAAAIKIADADQNLDTLSMRRVAESLGVGTMSLYTYLASRDELLEVMLDTVNAEAVEALSGRPKDEGWQDGLRRMARASWDLALRHPWTLQIFTGRPALGPNSTTRYELELAIVEGIGLDDVEMDAVITLVQTHVEGVARRRVEADRVVRQTGLTDEQWWALVYPPLSEVVEPSRFPISSRVGTAAGQAHHSAHNPEHAYAFGLERLIAGIAALVADPSR
jgi:AcrR family transcriptional regulator